MTTQNPKLEFGSSHNFIIPNQVGESAKNIDKVFKASVETSMAALLCR